MIWKEIIDDHLYVYFNGQLIFKRWLKQGYSMVFEQYGTPWVMPTAIKAEGTVGG